MTLVSGRQSRPGRRAGNRATLVVLLVVLLGAWLSHKYGGKNSPSPAAKDPIMSTVHTALTVDQTLHLPAGPRPTAADIDLQRASSTAAINSFFTGTAAAQERASLQQTLSKEAALQPTILSAGIENLTFRSITIKGNTATVLCSLTTWTRYTVTDPAGNTVLTQPRANVTANLTLVKNTSGRWLVTTYKAESANASGSAEPQ
ncbi:hypothetical protein SAMN05892883_0432 [Jatrophihabitans sp. GAS493]|uniref:hypothetical protein n=1 Tax=Jatrophihabitans sp. GAS493 TaxID=1907575 RepID=UPI000BC0537F|nr:hypothetical protein [Jatrophihabitans sp. GAS493]SOD70791.1 hypothetical protein SAMN05892883_0432 [Jatrophihabitans sp. GAS493]